METIRNYLDHMFAAYPDSHELRKIQSELLTMMEDKYQALKAEGKSENEAVGTVISEFGNIDEIIEEMNLRPGYKDEVLLDLPFVTAEEAESFIIAKRLESLMIACGVLLCIASPSFIIILSGIPFISESLGVGILLIFVAAAVGLFIYSGNRTNAYKHLKKPFYLSPQAIPWVEQELISYKQKATNMTVIGVGAIIISPILVIMFGNIPLLNKISIAMLLILVGLGVGCFIYPSGGEDACKMLLKEGNRRKKMKKLLNNK